MRLPALAVLGAMATLTATALPVTVLPADGAPPPRPIEYVKHTVYADAIVAGVTPGRPGNFHTIDVSGGIEVNFPLGPEQTSWVSVVVRDYTCPATTTLATFAPGACTSVGESSAQDEVANPYSEDVIGSSVRFRAKVPGAAGGGPLALDLRLVVDEPAPLTVQQVASDSTYTWTHLGNYLDGLADRATAIGTVAGIPVGGSNTRQTSVIARWDVARGRAPKPGDIQPPVAGWKLDDFPVRGWAYATVSTTGWMTGVPGNYHVFDWYVGTEYGYNEVDLANYRCPDPTAVDVDDPLASGCVVRAASYGEAGYLPLWKVGHSLALRCDGSTPKFTQMGVPSVTFNPPGRPTTPTPVPTSRCARTATSAVRRTGREWDESGSRQPTSRSMTATRPPRSSTGRRPEPAPGRAQEATVFTASTSRGRRTRLPDRTDRNARTGGRRRRQSTRTIHAGIGSEARGHRQLGNGRLQRCSARPASSHRST